MREFKITLKNGDVKVVNKKAGRDRSASKAAKALRYRKSQISKTNVGNPRHNK